MVFKMFSLFFSGCDDLRCRLLLRHFKFCPADWSALALVAMRRMAEAGLSSFGGSKPASEAVICNQRSYCLNSFQPADPVFTRTVGIFSLGPFHLPSLVQTLRPEVCSSADCNHLRRLYTTDADKLSYSI